MIKDQLFKRLSIPLSGIVFPFLAGLVSLSFHTPLQVIITILFFIAVAFIKWQGVVAITSYLRTRRRLQQLLFYKLAVLVAAGAAYGALCFSLLAFLWQRFVLQGAGSNALEKVALAGALFGSLLSLLYEIIFLSTERRVDDTVLQQLDRERQDAEASVLKNELDPHFFFNCMNTLAHLVREDGQKAYQFVHKLSSVYKYFLSNKEKAVVPLSDELEFLANYVYLLRIRFDDTICVNSTIREQQTPVYILPCSLQVLVENAMKHNFFSEKDPLLISIILNGAYITVSNPVRQGMQAAESTRVGLRNLKARYRILCNQPIIIDKTEDTFQVKLPILTKNNQHD